MKKIFLLLTCFCIVFINTITLTPSFKSKCFLTLDQVECLARNEGDGSVKPYIKCAMGSIDTGIHGVYSVVWCGDCKAHRVLVKGDGDCRLN